MNEILLCVVCEHQIHKRSDCLGTAFAKDGRPVPCGCLCQTPDVAKGVMNVVSFPQDVGKPHEHWWVLRPLQPGEKPDGLVHCACGAAKPFDLFEETRCQQWRPLALKGICECGLRWHQHTDAAKQAGQVIKDARTLSGWPSE
jgi:hypothetical protein